MSRIDTGQNQKLKEMKQNFSKISLRHRLCACHNDDDDDDYYY